VIRPASEQKQNWFPAEEPGAPLREYLAVLRFRKWSILGITFLVVASALFFSLRQTPIYESEAKVLVRPTRAASTASATASGVFTNLETEKVLVASEAVAKLVAEHLGLAEDPGSLLGDLEVSVATNTEVLLIRYADADPVGAQRRAQSFAESYLEFRRQQARDELDDAARAVREDLNVLVRRLDRVRSQLATASDPAGRSALETEATLLVGQIAVLQARLTEVTPTETLQVGQVVQPAGLPSSPASPNHVMSVGLALFVGLALGIGVAFLRERLDDRLRDRGDLEMRADSPILAVVPHVGTWKKKHNAPVVTIQEPKSASSEAYRMLRTGILFAATQRQLKTIIVTSASPGEGKTVTVANVAVAMAQANKRVIAVSADLRKPRLHQFFGLKNDHGLTNVLAGEMDSWRAVTRPSLPNMGILGSGPVPGNPAELLTSEAMGELLSGLRAAADFVLIDVPPVLVVSDALALAPFADGVILVADAQHTSRHAVSQARQQLDQVNAHVVGAVFNNFDPTRARARAHPYYYQYYSAYQHAEPRSSRKSSGGNGPAAPPAGEKPTKGMWSS
jgi:succinoglycan biosynthesis transport protein ExoP